METADLRARAARAHIVVVGAGVAGLVAARECAKLGIPVTLLEASERPGGVVRQADLGGAKYDVGAEALSIRDPTTAELLAELGLAELLQEPDVDDVWLSGVPGLVAMPSERLAGVPVNFFDEGVRQAIGWGGSWRAYLDRLRPPLTIGHEERFGRLVSKRMGRRVRDLLVAPLSRGVWGSDPDDLSAERVAPGIGAALTRTGSLSGAAASLYATSTPDLRTLSGGVAALVEALVADLPVLGGRVLTGVRVQKLERDKQGWSVNYEGSEDGALETLRAEAVIVATDSRSAGDLLGELLPVPLPTAFDVETVTMLVTAPELSEHPRAAVFPASAAPHVAITQPHAVWPWVRDAAGEYQVLRVTFGAQDEPPATATLGDDDALVLAIDTAKAHLGVAELHVAASHRARFVQSPPAAHIAASEQRDVVRERVRGTQGLGATGAWVAGTGLSRVIADAKAEADRVRSAVLWESTEA